MSAVHSKHTYVSLAGNDLSQYLNDSDWTRSTDVRQLTTYGNDNEVYAGGLGDGSTDLSGTYDNTAVTGPRAVIEPLIGTNAVFVYRPEGTGAGLPERSVDVVVGEYKETHPVADYVMWTCKLQHSGDVTHSTQA